MYLQPFLVYKQVLANEMSFGDPASKVEVLCKCRLQIDGFKYSNISKLNS